MSMNNKYLILILIVILVIAGVVFFGGLSQKESNLAQNSTNKLQVTTSFYPLYFFAGQIAGDKAEIKNITPSGSEPHDYEPTSQDIAGIEKSNLLILNGGVETWGDKIKENLKGKNVEVVVAGEGFLNQTLDEDGKRITDPHVWLSPELAKKEVQKITDGFIKVDPGNIIIYQNNQNKLNKELDQLNSEYRNGLSGCQRKDIITSHAAFGYLATSYGLNQVSIAGLSPDEEPSAKQLADIANFAKKENVKYIFFESLVSPKLSETIASEIGAKTLVLDPLEGLSDDNTKAGKNYFTVMRDNLKSLQEALECK